MKAIDPNMIESINVIKGDEAVKVYGETGKNGVIIITPKNQNYSLDIKVPVQTINVRTSQAASVNAVNTNAVNFVNVNSNINIAPLYVVNNQKVSVETVNKLQVDAIISVNVLKDQNAVKQYGHEGKNGVVEITTKKPLTGNR